MKQYSSATPAGANTAINNNDNVMSTSYAKKSAVESDCNVKNGGSSPPVQSFAANGVQLWNECAMGNGLMIGGRTLSREMDTREYVTGASGNSASQQAFGATGLPINAVSALPQTINSSSYNKHRQNATRTDSSAAGHHHNGSTISNSSAPHQTNASAGSGNNREKQTSMKQQTFSQNMLSKSQHFASIQFNQQAMLSQQTYLAQGSANNPAEVRGSQIINAISLGASPVNASGVSPVVHQPPKQQQNYIGSGLLNQGSGNVNNSMNSSTSQPLNNSGHYDSGVNCSQDQKQPHQNSNKGLKSNQHALAATMASPSKRGSKTSMSKRKNAASTIHQQILHQNSTSPGQPLLEASGLPPHQQAKIMTAQKQSLVQKRYSASITGTSVAQITVNSGNSGQQHPATYIQQQQQQMMQKQQISKQGNNSKSESNNKLRRISNMKQNKEKSNSDRRNQGLVLTNNQATSASGSVSQGLQVAQQYTQSSNPNIRFMHQNGQTPSHNISANNALASNLKSTTLSGASGGNGGAPANMSNLTSFQQSHSERTSMTDDAHHHSVLTSMQQWQMRDTALNNNHAQCSSERYINDQRVRFMQQLQSNSANNTANVAIPNSVVPTSDKYQPNSNTSSTSHVNTGSVGAKSGPPLGTNDNPLTQVGKKKNKGNEKLFFVTDAKLYEDEGAHIVSDQLNRSGQNTGELKMPPGHIQQHHQSSKQNLLQYDIGMEDIQVNAAHGGVNNLSASMQPKGSLLMYHSNKSHKKDVTQIGAPMPNAHALHHQHQSVRAADSTKQQSIVCPIYQSKDFRLMTGQQSSSMLSAKNQGSIASVQHLHQAFGNASKSDQKDVKRGSDGRKDSNKGATTGQGSAARRSMSDDMHEDVYMAKSDQQKPRKRTFKTSASSVVENQNTSQQATQHNSSINSSNEAYERSHYQQMKKNNSVFHQNAIQSKANQQKSWMQEDRFASSSQHYSETSSQKIQTGQVQKQERRDAEPLADKLLYLTNQACQSKVKSKSQLTNSMKSSQGIRKGIKSPGAQSTLQEPSAKAMPTSSKVKISQKFNKFEQSNPAYKVPGHPTKQNLFQTKTLKKQGSGPLGEFKELHKSPEARHGHVKKNGSISYAILPRSVLPGSDLKGHKKIKSPSPTKKLPGPEQIQRMRSPQTVKAQVSYQQSSKVNQSALHESLASSAHQHHQIVKDPLSTKNPAQQSQQLFEARRLSQQRSSHLSQKASQLTSHHQNKSHLLDNSLKSTNANSLNQSKRISFTDVHNTSNTNKGAGNEGADEAKKLYCMVDSRKTSHSSLHNAPNIGHSLGQVQILQVDSHGNNKSNAMSKVQLKTKDKLQNYMKPPGFLSQSPKAKKHPAAQKQSSALQPQSSMLMTHGSTSNPNVSQQKLAGVGANVQQKFVHQMQAAYSQANVSLQNQVMKNPQGALGPNSMTQKALLQIQAPKVVHLQSPPSRILVKASPRVSPNAKIRKQGIQTCKVSIDALQKNGQQKVNRANSKEFLKTIKLMKRSSNSSSPQSNPNNAASPELSSQQNRPSHQQSSQQYDSTTQLKNFNTQTKQIERQSSQNSNSTLIRPTSQGNKLFSRLQLRRAKEAQMSSGNNNEIVSFSERQTHDVKAQSTASLIAPLSYQSNPAARAQQLVDQFSNQVDSGKQTSHSHQSQQEPNSAMHQNHKMMPPQQVKASGSSARMSKDRHNASILQKTSVINSSMNQALDEAKGKERSSHNPPRIEKIESYDEKGQVTIERHEVPSTELDKNEFAPRKQRSIINSNDMDDGSMKLYEQQQSPQVPQTPSKKINSKQVTPLSPSNVKEEEENVHVTRQGNANTFKTPKTDTYGTSQGGDPAHGQTNSKMFTNMSNEEMREQAMFQKDIEKLKRMIKLHFQNYNTAPPTSCEFYRIGRVLGKGAFGKVSLAMHKIAEQLVAIKSMSKETLQCEVDQRRRTKLEMGILKQCNHPNVVRLFDTFETSKHICFVIELCSGGDLFSYIKKRRRLKEDVARFFFKQLVEGLAYIHNAKKVVHRDIKLENILLDATGNVKICDFGVSRQLQTGKERMKEQCGTPAYIAPEILLDEGYVGFKVDMWSAGVCLYAMLIGSVPFKASTMSKLQDLIIKGEYDFKFQTNANSKQLNNPKAATTLLSEEVQDLISQLLQTNPSKRLSAVETLNHPWLQQGDPNLDVYTEKEKQLIQREYMRLNLKLGQNHRLHSATKSTASKAGLMMSPNSQMHLDSEQILFTEHNLETRMGEEEPNLQNQEEKSFILAPFNSVKSMFIDQGNQIKEVKKDDPPFIWPKEVTDLIAPRRVIKFSTKCREKNRIYEQNNNADLDNGVYNEFVNEQEREEGALMNGQQEDGKDDLEPSSMGHAEQSSSDEEGEGTSQKRHMVSRQNISSEDSLEKSFKETELASDDEEASIQIAEAKKLQSIVNHNQEAFNLLNGSIEQDQQQQDLSAEDDEQEESPAREQVMTKQTPLGNHPPPLQNQAKSIQKASVPSKMPGAGLTKQKSRPQLRQQVPAKASIIVHEYVEPEFVIDYEVVGRIQTGGVIPRWYLLQELELLANDQDRVVATRDKTQRLNYVTATYFLLCKRKELEELQRRQEGQISDAVVTPRKEEAKKQVLY